MTESSSTESPLAAATGDLGMQATEAFELVSNETRLAILLALWEAFDPETSDNAVSFSDLRERVGVRDSGQFNYHLGKLTDRFVKDTDDGYELRMLGFKIVKAIIAGTGREDQALPPTEIDMSCHQCGGAVEIRYEHEHLFYVCTECEGTVPSDIPDDLLFTGTLARQDFNAAGLADRTPQEVFVAATIERFQTFGLLSRGLCPECSGAIDETLHVCTSHETSSDEVCPNCDTRDEVRIRYVCSVCKWWGLLPVEAALYDHPAIVAFCHEMGIELTWDLDDPETGGGLWNHFAARQHTLVSEDPIRIRVCVPGDDERLQLTIDENLSVIDTRRTSISKTA